MRNPTLFGPTTPVCSSTRLPPPTPIEHRSGILKLVRTPAMLRSRPAGCGYPPLRRPTSLVVPPTSITMASASAARIPAPRKLLVGPEATVKIGNWAAPSARIAAIVLADEQIGRDGRLEARRGSLGE